MLVTLAACDRPNEVGEVGVDWTGNDISVEAVADPDVQGVVCHVAYFNRCFIDRLQQGNWFEDPSYSAVDCEAAGPITIGNIDLDKAGEEIFRAAALADLEEPPGVAHLRQGEQLADLSRACAAGAAGLGQDVDLGDPARRRRRHLDQRRAELARK